MRRLVFIIIPVLAAIALGFWIADKFIQEPTAAPITTSDASNPIMQHEPLPVKVDTNTTLGIATSVHLGSYLIGANGHTLYSYAKDQAGTSTCYDACAQKWIPYTVPAGVRLNLQVGVQRSQADTLTRVDHSTQVTYRGLPLYYYAGDTTRAEASGQGLGGVWYTVTP